MAEKRKRGRPQVITPAVEKRLLKLIAGGKTLHEACRAVKISYDTLANKRLRDDKFFGDSARATLLGCEANLSLAETRLKRSTNRRISVDRELAHHFRWKAAKLLSAYKDKVTLDHQHSYIARTPSPASSAEEWLRNYLPLEPGKSAEQWVRETSGGTAILP